MKISELLNEALPLKTAKKYRAEWNPNTYSDIFKNYPCEKDKNAYRLYFPLEDEKVTANPPKDIATYVNSKGYTVSDYVSGYASNIKDPRRVTRIGKLLSDNPKLKTTFDSDPIRQGSKKSGLVAIISRHPYDIAGMSTDRGWTSCMNLSDGMNKKYVMADVKEGSIIAYLVDNNDKNIKHPLGRILIKPFINKQNKAEFILYPEDQPYGHASAAFINCVDAFCTKVNDGKDFGLYCLKPKLYSDSRDEIRKNPNIPEEIVKIMPKLSEQQLYGLYNTFGFEIFKYITNEKLIVGLISRLSNDDEPIGFILKYLRNPSEKIVTQILFNDEDAVRFIQNPSEKIMKYSVNNDYTNIRYFRNAPEEIQMYALKAGAELDVISNPSEKVQMYAINQDFDSLFHIKKPSENVLKYAATLYPGDLAMYTNDMHIPVSEELIKYIIQREPDNILEFNTKIQTEDNQIFALKCCKTAKEVEYLIRNLHKPNNKVKEYALQFIQAMKKSKKKK